MASTCHLVLGALLRKKTRTAFTLASLAMAFLLIGLLQAVNSVLSGGADFLGANRLITQAKTSFTQPLPMRLLPQIEAVPGVDFVSHSQFFGGVYQDARNFFPQFAVNPQRLFDTYPEWVLPDAQRRAFISTRDGAIAGKVLADKYGWKVGDIIPLNSFIWTKTDGTRVWEWRLVGIFDGRDKEWSERANLMYLNYGQFDEARVTGAKGLAGVFVVRVADPMQSDGSPPRSTASSRIPRTRPRPRASRNSSSASSSSWATSDSSSTPFPARCSSPS